ncbi:MAG: right-handed parallel beta-helix repeat-containing protein [Chloroflexota bacterium]|nr:right-handed parallel beta-helix repeat-containing protein [Chloroflexota bacterium]
MRKPFRIAPLIALALAVVIVTAGSSIADRADRLTLVSPSTCPAGGCAAGQRLNYEVEYSVTPDFDSGANTQVCVYATSGWADFSNGWLSDEGLLSKKNYTLGETDSVCTNNAGAYDWFAGAYAELDSDDMSDRLEFALNITASASSSGEIIVKVFELNDSASWEETSQFQSDTISPVAALDDDVFVADTAADCGGYAPCFINSGDDLAEGIGTGLRDAVLAQNPGDDIVILGNYPIKGQTVLIDKAVTISGMNDGAITTYSGAACNNAMLLVESGATVQDLAISDGDCDSPSRTLIEVDSSDDVTIEHNTLSGGNFAIDVKNNSAAVTVAFNQIENNNYPAVYNRGSANKVDVYANNILNNGSTYQINCNSHGTADHNFWGEGAPASGSALNCDVVNGKQLGAAIELSEGDVGVEAIRQQVTSLETGLFNDNIFVKHDGGSDYTLIIVNHGQGSDANIPFNNDGAGYLRACSNFYDVFLPEESLPTNLELSIQYDLNSQCTSTIESTEYCGSSQSEKYPLWWYDPLNGLTEGWERTTQNMTCDMEKNRVTVIIDNSGHPNLATDLASVPLVAGLPGQAGITLSQMTIRFDGDENIINWTTSTETNVIGFHVLRSDNSDGPYARVSPRIDSYGNPSVGGIYNYTDNDIVFRRTYYYKLEVVNEEGETIETHGPVSVLTSTATPTVTLTRTPTITRTPYPTRTSTPYYYRSPTSYYRPATATPRSGPTQVRTYGPTPTPNRTSQTKPTYDPTMGEGGFPAEDPAGTEIAQGYPLPERGADSDRTTTPQTGSSGQDGSGTGPDGTGSGELSGRPRVQWIYLAAGAASGLVLLAATSFALSKTLTA